MSELTDFLLERIAEDEAAARRIAAASCHYFRFANRSVAECEAKRRIVEMHAGPHYCSGRHRDAATGLNDPCATVQQIGTVYADHPDYRKEWKP